MKQLSHDLPKELLPVVNLLHAQSMRTYVAGAMWAQFPETDEWVPCDGTLTGIELSLLQEGVSSPKYINISDCSVSLLSKVLPHSNKEEHSLSIMQDYHTTLVVLLFDLKNELVDWLSAIQLAKLEHASLNEAYTAVMVSLKGPELSDIETLLAHKKRFPRFEWCNLRLPQASSKWIRVYMAIIPADNKKGRIEMYSSDKLSKKNLILYVNDVQSIFNVFPEDQRMISKNSLMKVEGQIFVNKGYEHLFSGLAGSPSISSPGGTPSGSRKGSYTSLNSLAAPPGPSQQVGRSRSTSVNSSHSFFMNSPRPASKETLTPSSPPRGTSSSHFYKKQSVNKFVATNYLYLMPEVHPAVSPLEIMVRNFLHIIDAFKLYGRPNRISNDKRNVESMLFGLPSLPHYGYLSAEDAFDVVDANYDTARIQEWNELDWRSCLKEYLACKQNDGDYKGVGNIKDLYESVESESPFDETDGVLLGMNSPKILFPAYSRGASPQPPSMPLPPSRFSQVSNTFDSEMFSNGTDRLDSDPNLNHSLSLNEGNYLGKPFEHRSTAAPSPPRGQDDVLRSLEPIADMPTPLDDKKAQYFNNGQTLLIP